MTGTKQFQFYKPYSIYVYLMPLTISEAVRDAWPARQAKEAALWEKTGARSVSSFIT
jgi:hypothetical protein